VTYFVASLTMPVSQSSDRLCVTYTVIK